ncbi:hypothetical protein MA4S0116R_0913 [Mycobacteroides abscessus 4S-0116-R]|nr:hypothetical protein MA4S0206_0066 [Mycobacteroides abscessus 4S-0206]EIV52582.1 hypothetical protein MA4S0116R_0913 [Mycobacteroides abscessus 4S-0116-R]
MRRLCFFREEFKMRLREGLIGGRIADFVLIHNVVAAIVWHCIGTPFHTHP